MQSRSSTPAFSNEFALHMLLVAFITVRHMSEEGNTRGGGMEIGSRGSSLIADDTKT
jgi:predicted alpha/beta-hydrolase family hydrolase